MSSLDKLFANSLKNDITHTFVESVEAIMFLEGISSEDFLRTNRVKVFTPILEEPSFLSSNKKLTVTDKNYQQEVDYDILSVWLYKLSENLRRIYSAKKKNNDYSNLIQQQNNLYTVSNYFLNHWDTHNEPSFFPRAIFGRHMDYLAPLDYLIYLGTHDCLTSENFSSHLKIVNKLYDKLDLEEIPDFIPKLALSAKNSKLFKTILPRFSQDSLLYTLQYNKSSDGFTILSVEYILENSGLFSLYDYQKTEIVNMLLHKDILLSKHFDDFILDKNEFLNQLSTFISPNIAKNIETVFVNKTLKNAYYKNFETVFLRNQKKSNPYALINELKVLTFEEIIDSYALSSDLISDTIDKIVELSNLKKNQHTDYLFSSFNNLVQKLHPVLEKQHLAKIISQNSQFLDFCKPVYLHIKLQEKYPTKTEYMASSEKKNKI